MMNDSDKYRDRPLRCLIWLVLLSIIAAVVIMAVGYFPTQAWAGSKGIAAMSLGVGIALLAALAGLVPSVLMIGQGGPRQMNGMLMGMALRFIITLVLLLAALLSGYLPKLALAVWVAIGYVVLLASGYYWRDVAEQALCEGCAVIAFLLASSNPLTHVVQHRRGFTGVGWSLAV